MPTKQERIAQEVARAVGAGKPAALETVDFSDPNRPRTCLEVDFPILPVNQVAAIEGNAGKPIYQMSKWWARRRSSVFRSMLIAAATRAPDDPAHAAKRVWDNYYANHQKKGAFKHLKVADIFMGGGTTLVEGSRLGMQMSGNDLNPVAWFVTKQALADIDIEEVERLLAQVEAEVKPQIMPFYYCDGPNGEKGTWTHEPSGKVMGANFDPLSLTPEDRKDYSYEGPEIVYTFWAKHGPCQVTDCGHRTPIMTTPVMAVKTLTVKHWKQRCRSCGTTFDAESAEARMAPDVPLYVSPEEAPYAVIDAKGRGACPECGGRSSVTTKNGKNKKVELSLLVHPEWLAGSPKEDDDGNAYGGSAQDNAVSTERWNQERTNQLRVLEVRGTLPDKVTCPETGTQLSTGKTGGTVPKKSHFACGACGTVQDVLEAVKASEKTGPIAGYAVQAYSPERKESKAPYRGRFFLRFDKMLTSQYNAATHEWEARKNGDLREYWPRSELPYGFMTHHLQGGVPNHGFTHWSTMFNPRQLLVLAQILKAINDAEGFSLTAREFVLGAFQQYTRNQNLFTIWNRARDEMEPHFSNNNFHPKSTTVENGVFSALGRGNWRSCSETLLKAVDWQRDPWEIATVSNLEAAGEPIAGEVPGKSTKVSTHDPVRMAQTHAASSTDLSYIPDHSTDLVITDPPFGGLLHYSELSDFFHVWLRLALADRYPSEFGHEFTPKAMEAVSNKAREPEDPEGFYQRLLTACWTEAHRVLKPGGMLAFTFHHSEDAPWVAVLEALFDAGFFLQATYPIRSDETKGEGEFGSKTIEFDIIHVCRKRTEEPKPVSWARMRREVLADVRQLQGLLENHARAGLPQADLQVIRRGKALEYFSRHYGKVYTDKDRPLTVKEALVGINQLIDEGGGNGGEAPPGIAEPITRQFLGIFTGKTELARDQMQKLLRGSGVAPDEFVRRGWAYEEKKTFLLSDPLAIAQEWHGRHRRRLKADLDQALMLTGACFDGSGISASDTLRNENFKPHPALKSLLEWLAKRGQSQPIRNAAQRALRIYITWESSHKEEVQQMSLFQEG